MLTACVCGPCVWQLEQVTQLEQEEEVLLQGLRVMTRGRDWCLQQLQHVQERQRLGQSKTSAVSDLPDPPPQCSVPGQWLSLHPGSGDPPNPCHCDAHPPATVLALDSEQYLPEAGVPPMGTPSWHSG